MTIMSHQEVSCPWCGEYVELMLDGSQPSQEYVEDCQVCCRPILVHIDIDGCGQLHLQVNRENE